MGVVELADTQTNGIFQINVDSKGKEATWVIDMKEDGKVTKGAGKQPGEWS